ncbi:YsnF/AvaK domain-containing protein [Rhodoligotrophos defluvii]|uniref:YsnF/AvaK domain-containing protein n=1 Tax=Rhodoligotrophos defluvii TaxID=2561934 RepID=UPI001EF05A2D|nr:YsnF/AvaK domain-containing protein [Rhodoligotrophos defluvii]
MTSETYAAITKPDADDADEASDRDEMRRPDTIRETLIPLHAEELSVSKEKVETGRVHVGTVTRTHEALVDEELASDHVQIERVAVNEPVDAVPPVRQEGNVTIVPVLEEVLVLERRLMLKEEIHIRRVHTTERHRESVTLRRQEAVISRSPAEPPPE